MKKNKQELIGTIFFVIKLTIIGLLSGFIGMMSFAAVTPPTDLYADIRNALLAGLFTMITAATVVIYRHNRKSEKESDQNN